MTKQYGTLGYPIKHSLSPVVHNAAFKALGIDAQYGIFEVAENNLPGFVEQVKSEPISGFSVTAPYKEVIMEYLNKVVEDARKIGAVNTVVNEGGFLYGYNVDYIGIVRALGDVCGDLKGLNVTVIGAGGAARAAVYGLLEKGAKVSIYNRTMDKAGALAEEFSRMFGVEVLSGGLETTSEKLKNDLVKSNLQNGHVTTKIQQSGASVKNDAESKSLPGQTFGGDSGDNFGGDVLVQTSSIWMLDPNAKLEDLISEEHLAKFNTVMDIVYKPFKTPLILAAEKLGKKAITGDKMFLYQAAEQFKLWTKQEAPLNVMRGALEKVLVY